MSHSSLYEVQVEEVGSDMAGAGGTSCPVCRNPDARPRFRIAGLESVIRECPGCGLGWMDPLPDPQTLASFYPSHYYGADGSKFRGGIEWVVRLVGARRLRFITSHLPRGAAVLDIGCGRGVLLKDLADRGYRVFGTERSPDAARGADPRAEIRFGETLRDAAFDADFFDQVIIWHVFEHLPDPSETLREIHRILKPGGSVIIAVPNFSSWQARWAGADWFHLDPPRHLYHFSTGSLARLLGDCGFILRSWHHFSLRQNPFGWVQSLLNRSSREPRNSLYSWLLHGGRDPDVRTPFWTRVRHLLEFAVGMPPATGLEVVAATFRRGATVHLIATKPQDESP
jgi:SAM-dependent methyltransferase